MLLPVLRGCIRRFQPVGSSTSHVWIAPSTALMSQLGERLRKATIARAGIALSSSHTTLRSLAYKLGRGGHSIAATESS